MGLGSFIGKVGKNYADQFGQPVRAVDFAGTYVGQKPGWSMSDYAIKGPLVNGAVLGAAPGALFGAAGNPDDPGGAALSGALTGGGIVGGAVAAGGGAVMLKRLIVAVAQAMKQKMPEASENEIMLNAQRVVQDAMSRPDARAQVEKILGKMNWGPRDPGSPY